MFSWIYRLEKPQTSSLPADKNPSGNWADHNYTNLHRQGKCQHSEGCHRLRTHWWAGDISKQVIHNLGTRPAKIAVDRLDSVSLKGGVYDVIADPVLNCTMIHSSPARAGALMHVCGIKKF